MRTDNPDENVDASIADTDRTRGPTQGDRVELEHRVERLRAQNKRLRDGVDNSRRHRLRLTALGFVGLGVLSFAAAFVLPNGQEVLYALAGVGLFAGLLTRSVTGSRFVESGDAERVYATCAANYEAILARRGLETSRWYCPTEDDRVRLFVPADSDDAPRPTEGDASVGFGDDGLVLKPIGTEFVREVVETGSDATETPAAAVEQLSDALEARFEFVTAAEPAVDIDRGRAEIAVSGSAFGAVDRFDHPVASTLAVGLAGGLERPVRLEVTDDTDRGEWLVRCAWDADAAIDAN
ncbi:hypothetical protein Htur_2507 [Haloterrigena turkmenica DSM 5511]|uniref:DUF7982 domain-containing protein n=1 Tax=Haloterrigena turkmenica (strain ATCC 51198 / DSM 5511 / JCM 9101 / NCIMB 13204 / VKM B-1734 / 4k) TaxID=543526 RepID=D2RVV5_HALTV|nr:hypothetical protein [Haloterrigena turkmenica]ADB61384.1 hypothetical protein Htur_2507 [Haloterrigena turkmenica DSM 5511]